MGNRIAYLNDGAHGVVIDCRSYADRNALPDHDVDGSDSMILYQSRSTPSANPSLSGPTSTASVRPTWTATNSTWSDTETERFGANWAAQVFWAMLGDTDSDWVRWIAAAPDLGRVVIMDVVKAMAAFCQEPLPHRLSFVYDLVDDADRIADLIEICVAVLHLIAGVCSLTDSDTAACRPRIMTRDEFIDWANVDLDLGTYLHRYTRYVDLRVGRVAARLALLDAMDRFDCVASRLDETVPLNHALHLLGTLVGADHALTVAEVGVVTGTMILQQQGRRRARRVAFESVALAVILFDLVSKGSAEPIRRPQAEALIRLQSRFDPTDHRVRAELESMGYGGAGTSTIWVLTRQRFLQSKSPESQFDNDLYLEFEVSCAFACNVARDSLTFLPRCNVRPSAICWPGFNRHTFPFAAVGPDTDDHKYDADRSRKLSSAEVGAMMYSSMVRDYIGDRVMNSARHCQNLMRCMLEALALEIVQDLVQDVDLHVTWYRILYAPSLPSLIPSRPDLRHRSAFIKQRCHEMAQWFLYHHLSFLARYFAFDIDQNATLDAGEIEAALLQRLRPLVAAQVLTDAESAALAHGTTGEIVAVTDQDGNGVISEGEFNDCVHWIVAMEARMLETAAQLHAQRDPAIHVYAKALPKPKLKALALLRPKHTKS